jgi:hypothetical protein
MYITSTSFNSGLNPMLRSHITYNELHRLYIKLFYTTNSLIFFIRNILAYHKAGIVVVNAAIVGLDPRSKILPV